MQHSSEQVVRKRRAGTSLFVGLLPVIVAAIAGRVHRRPLAIRQNAEDDFAESGCLSIQTAMEPA